MKPQLKTISQALTYQLEDMYDAEKKIQLSFKGLDKMLSSAPLREEVVRYLESAANKRLKLKRIFSYLLSGPYKKKNGIVSEFLAEIRGVFKVASPVLLKDSMFIASMQNLVHYKIAAYGTARAIAEELDLTTVANLLDQMLQWEKETDRALSRIAMQQVNSSACHFILQA